MLVLPLLVLVVAEGAWWFSAYRAAQAQQTELVKIEVASLLRERAAGTLTPEYFSGPLTDAQQEVLRGMFAQIQSPRIIRMKVWSKDQVVLWSNLSEIIGQRFPDNDEVKDAYDGEVVLAIEEQKAEHISERQFTSLAEIYVPIQDAGGKTFGVLEIYEPSSVVDDPARAKVMPAAEAAAAVTLVAYALYAVWAVRSSRRGPPAAGKEASAGKA
jgi:hypothetical protein